MQSESEIQQILCKDSRILQGFQEINVQPDTAFSLLINKLRSDIFRIPLIFDLQSRVSSGWRQRVTRPLSTLATPPRRCSSTSQTRRRLANGAKTLTCLTIYTLWPVTYFFIITVLHMAPAVDLAGGGGAGARAGDHHGAAGGDEEEREQHRLQPRRWAGEEGDY